MARFSRLIHTLILGAGVLALTLFMQTATAAEQNSSSAKKIDEVVADIKAPEKIISQAEKAAIALFAYQRGEWTSEWNMYDATGNRTSTLSGTISFTPLLGENTQRMTHVIPQLGHESVAIRGFNTIENKIVTFNMARDGTYWELRQNPITGVTLSDPRQQDDGTMLLERFTRLTEDENSYKVMMEISLDSGSTWFKRYNQTLTRVTK